MRVPSLASSRIVPWRWLLGLPGRRRTPVCVCALHATRLVGCASGEAARLQFHYSKANGPVSRSSLPRSLYPQSWLPLSDLACCSPVNRNAIVITRTASVPPPAPPSPLGFADHATPSCFFCCTYSSCSSCCN